MPLAEVLLCLNSSQEITQTIPKNYDKPEITKPIKNFVYPFNQKTEFKGTFFLNISRLDLRDRSIMICYKSELLEVWDS